MIEKMVYSIFGYAIGFLVSAFLWGKTEGAVGLITNLRFNIGNRGIALHHWMLFLILAVLLLLTRNRLHLPDKIFYFTLGIFFGGLNHGVTYKDWFRIVSQI